MNVKCVYCLQDQPQDAFIKTEHVLPQSFGVFNNNFTLNKVVCDSCNTFFGKELEIALARDSMEGLIRYDHNLKSPSEFKTTGKKSRRIFRFPDGELKGAYSYPKYSPEAKRILLYPLPQVGFLKGNEREFFLLDQIPDKDYLLKNFNMQNPQAVLILGCDPALADKILIDKGITVRDCGQPDFPPDDNKIVDVVCDVEGVIDQTILRAIAKIGFNYLTYWQKSPFVLHEDFNIIRRYILTGEKVNYPLIQVEQNSILGDEPIEGRRRSGHIVTTDWAGDGTSIIAQVSLMNWMKYKICLARNFSGEHKDIKMGHFFNFSAKSIHPLTTDKDATG